MRLKQVTAVCGIVLLSDHRMSVYDRVPIVLGDVADQ
jgi:hypothetical protein